MTCWAQGTHIQLAAGLKLSIDFCSLLCPVNFFSPSIHFFSLLIFCHLWLCHKWRKEDSLLLSPPCSGGSFSATRPCFSLGFSKELSWQNSSKRQWLVSNIVLSSWAWGLTKIKTPVRVKCLAQLRVCPMLNLKGRGVRGGSSSSSKCFLAIVSAEVSVKDVLCPQAVDVPKVWVATPIHQLTCFHLGTSGLVKPVNIKKSSAYHTGGGVRDGRATSTPRELRGHCSHSSGFGQTLQSNIGKAVPIPQGLSSTRDLAEGQIQLLGVWGAARSPRLGWWGLVVGTI